MMKSFLFLIEKTASKMLLFCYLFATLPTLNPAAILFSFFEEKLPFLFLISKYKRIYFAVSEK